MKTASLATITLLVLVNVGLADHNRPAADQAFALVAEARDLRWDIRMEFANSVDQRDLLRDSTHVYESLVHLEEMFFDNSSEAALVRYINHIQSDIAQLDSSINTCDFARPLDDSFGRGEGPQRGLTHERFNASPRHHECYGHVLTIKARLQNMVRGLELLERSVCSVGHVGHVRQPLIGQPLNIAPAPINQHPGHQHEEIAPPVRSQDPRFVPTTPSNPSRPPLMVPQSSNFRPVSQLRIVLPLRK
ncbi:MAG: hypothetical protein R3C01_03215 [Planctomycetaceae bacterium]